jgi:hypothetical protein
MTPNLERMIEDLEEIQWYITSASAMVRKMTNEIDGYKVEFGHIEHLEKERNFCTFQTIQETFKQCIEEAWKKLV